MGMPSCYCVPPNDDDPSERWIRECDHHRTQREALEIARGALADIYTSSDMTLRLARKKAKRIYLETAPNKNELTGAPLLARPVE